MTRIVIVGGGVAGLAAAIAARLAGLKATVLERGEKPPERPGETLHPGSEALFLRLGVLDAVTRAATARHRGIILQDERGTHRQPYGGPPSAPWLGFQIPRSDLHSILLERARQLGAEVRFNCAARATSFGLTGGLVLTSENQDLSGDWLFDGSGSSNWSARNDDIAYAAASPQMTACYGYHDSRGSAGFQAWPRLKTQDWGWSWDADLGNGTIAWVKLFKSREAMLRHRPPSCRTTDVTWKVSSAPARHSTFRIGDAALRMDPSSGKGVLRAIMSAMMAVHLVKAVQDGKIEQTKAAPIYSAWITSWFRSDARELSSLLGAGPGSQAVESAELAPF